MKELFVECNKMRTIVKIIFIICFIVSTTKKILFSWLKKGSLSWHVRTSESKETSDSTVVSTGSELYSPSTMYGTSIKVECTFMALCTVAVELSPLHKICLSVPQFFVSKS